MACVHQGHSFFSRKGSKIIAAKFIRRKGFDPFLGKKTASKMQWFV
jgi:hypothetical protein